MNRVRVRLLIKIYHFLSAISLLLLGGLANAQFDLSSFDQRTNAIVEPLRREADSGNLQSLHALAEVYFSLFCCSADEGYERNGERAKQAVNYLMTQYQEGDAVLEFMIGRFYNFGLGVEENDQMAFSWWLKSANHGNDEAQNNVANYYENGRVVDKDLDKAMEWYQKSASQDNFYAAANIGNLYYEGIGREVDCRQALKWFKLAAQQGNSIAVEAIEKIAKDPQCVTKNGDY